jgi:hypothetical protein
MGYFFSNHRETSLCHSCGLLFVAIPYMRALTDVLICHNSNVRFECDVQSSRESCVTRERIRKWSIMRKNARTWLRQVNARHYFAEIHGLREFLKEIKAGEKKVRGKRSRRSFVSNKRR